MNPSRSGYYRRYAVLFSTSYTTHTIITNSDISQITGMTCSSHPQEHHALFQ
jgi:hypothetical protein